MDARTPPGPRMVERTIVAPICRIDLAMALVWKKWVTACTAPLIACDTLWKKLDSHEKPFGSVKASGSLPT